MDQFSFQIATGLADLLISEDAEGDSSRYNFNAEQWFYLKYCLRLIGTVSNKESNRQIVVTKELRDPI